MKFDANKNLRKDFPPEVIERSHLLVSDLFELLQEKKIDIGSACGFICVFIVKFAVCVSSNPGAILKALAVALNSQAENKELSEIRQEIKKHGVSLDATT